MDVYVSGLGTILVSNRWIRLLHGVQSATDENSQPGTLPSEEHRILHQWRGVLSSLAIEGVSRRDN